jgi:heptosyltransferase-2
LATTSTLGIKNDNKGLDYFIPAKDQLPTSWLPEEYHKGFVVYAIGGQHATKKLPVAKMIELCKQVSLPLILIGDQKINLKQHKSLKHSKKKPF